MLKRLCAAAHPRPCRPASPPAACAHGRNFGRRLSGGADWQSAVSPTGPSMNLGGLRCRRFLSALIASLPNGLRFRRLSSFHHWLVSLNFVRLRPDTALQPSFPAGPADLLARRGKQGILLAGQTRFARVAQLDRASVSEAEGCGFNSRRAHHLETP